MTKVRNWPVLLGAAGAAVAVWSGWVGLGALCGFGLVQPFPGIVAWHLDTAITLPVGVEAYGAWAIATWLNPAMPAAARRYARRSAFIALGLGMAGQVAYHLLTAAGVHRAPWPVTMFVACLPVATLGMFTGLAHIRSAEAIPLAAPMAAEPATQTAISQPLAQPSDGHSDGQPDDHEVATEPAIPVAAEPATVPAIEAPAAQPHSQPASQPRRRAATGTVDGSKEAKAARRAYRKSVADGAPLSDRALGAEYEQTRAWGAARIREVKEAPSLAEAR